MRPLGHSFWALEIGPDVLFALQEILPTMPFLMSWENQARCLTYDPDIFFAPRARAERRAKEICADCPVQVQCLDYALAIRVEFGIWGGTNSKERRIMLRRLRSRERTLEPAIA